MKKWLIKKASYFVFPLTKGNSKLKISLILIIVVETLLYNNGQKYQTKSCFEKNIIFWVNAYIL